METVERISMSDSFDCCACVARHETSESVEKYMYIGVSVVSTS